MTSPQSPDGDGRHSRQPLRRTTRAEANQARRALRGWRTRKLALILAGLPVVAIGLAGYAMAAPGFRHHHPPAPACASASATAGQSSAAAGTSPSASAGASGANSASASASLPASTPGTNSASAPGTNSASASVSVPASVSASVSAPSSATATASATAAMTTATAGAAPTATASCGASTTASATVSASATATGSTGTVAAPNPNCTLVVPAAPLTAQGLATPYQLVATDAAMGPCHETNVNQSAFVQATVYDPQTGALSVYDPLVVDQGTTPAAPSVLPTLPADAVVGIWFGFNATNLTLQDSNGSLAAGNCVDGLGTSVFGQFAYCNAPAFFAAVNKGIAAGAVKVPAPGNAVDGGRCLTTRDFALIDQDQSDNVTTDYLATADGRTAQDSTANAAAVPGAVTLANPSDNALLDNFVDPALHCTAWTEPNLGNGGTPATSLGLDEIQANAFSPRPPALVPLNDPMTLVNGAFSQAKTNLYRAGVDQPAVPAGTGPQAYCADLDSIQSTRLQQDVNLLINRTTPSAAAANSLFAFLGMRLQQSFGNLNCQNFGLTNPVSSLATNGNGVVVGAVFAHRVNPVTPGAGNPAEACVTTADPAAQAACALNAVGGAGTQSGAPSPTASAPTPRPSGDMHHRSGHHW